MFVTNGTSTEPKLFDQQMIHFVILSGIACLLIVLELSRQLYVGFWRKQEVKAIDPNDAMDNL